jgi:uncharacterized protein YecE (DUF72 family)
MRSLKIGCCGFAGGMKKYFTKFNVVEVQQTFYHLPTFQTAEKWYSLAPQNFEFCMKAWQGITHPATSPTYRRFRGKLEKRENYGFFQQTGEVLRSWRETEKICFQLKAVNVLFQCPASFKPTEKNLENIIWFFKIIKNSKYRFVWEPRGSGWTDDIILDICKKGNLVHCVDPFVREPVTRDMAYFRLHGSPPGKKMYYYDYTEKDLNKLINLCQSFSKVYCLFNNMNMYQNALQIIKMRSTR